MNGTVKTMIIKYEVSRSRDFQSARVGGEITMQIPEGTDSTETFNNGVRWLARQCNHAAEEQLANVLYGGEL